MTDFLNCLQHLLHICLEISEPNQTEQSRVPKSSELSLETSRAQLIGLSFESSLSPEPTSSLKLNPSQAESSTEVSSASSQAGSASKVEPVPDPKSGLEPNRVPSRVPSQVPSLESSLSRSDA